MEITDPRLPPYLRSSLALEPSFWPEIEPRLPLLQAIITDHFGSQCGEFERLEDGLWTRRYHAELEDGGKLFIEISLPIRDALRMEAMVAAMDSIRARTAVPASKVHLFCSTRSNPLGAEWIVMDRPVGVPYMDCVESLGAEQKQRTARDLADAVVSLYDITATHCGTILRDHSLCDSQRARRYGEPCPPLPTVESHLGDGHFTIGPSNELKFMATMYAAPMELCGPSPTETAYLETLAFAALPHTLPAATRYRRWGFHKILAIHEKVRPLYAKGLDVDGTFYQVPTSAVFRLTHDFLYKTNVLVDPSTGAITGITEWDTTGFRPAWQAGSSMAWLWETYRRRVPPIVGADDDDNWLLIEDTTLSEYFYDEVKRRSPELWAHFVCGEELRSIYFALCESSPGSAEVWVGRYAEEWDTDARGPFPFDVWAWIESRLDTWNKLHAAGQDDL